MKKKIEKINELAKKTGKGIKSTYDKTIENVVKVIDQNDDGSFDKDDVNTIKEKFGDLIKNTTSSVVTTVEERIRTSEIKRLKPVFVSSLSESNFNIPKLLLITDMPKIYAESEVCKGAIGFMSPQKDIEVINIFKNEINEFGLTFYPDTNSEVYYVDPSDRNNYIALEDYFYYLKIARINELQKIAQDLGAKYFKVTYKEYKASYKSNKVKAKANEKIAGTAGTVEAERDLSSKEISNIEVAAEMNFPGHEPFEPSVKFLRNEPGIQSLISLRMDKSSPILNQKYVLKLSNSSGIKEKDAIKIDAALKALKISGTTTFASEVRNESRRYFEYEVDFK